jgi:hypothetical protein
LRQEAGVSILKARELTHYSNYERWESGQTKVGADHLGNIGAAFGTGNDLWLLFAWLVDRLTPVPGSHPIELDAGEIRRHFADMPEAAVDLGEHDRVALVPIKHRDLAVLGLMARYGCGYAAVDRPPVLAPTKRMPVPPSTSPDISLLRSLYGDVLCDLGSYAGKTLMLGGLRQLQGKVQLQVNRFTLLLLTEPEYMRRLLAAGAPPASGRRRGLGRLAWLAARLAPRVERMANTLLEDLRRCEEEAAGEPVSIADVKVALREAALDDALWDSPLAPSAVAELKRLPEPNAALTGQLRVLHDQVDRAARRAITQELDDARTTADPSSALDALSVLQGESADR